jgi:hypothetical protein
MQYADLFPDLPDEARLWVFPAKRDLPSGSGAAVLSRLRAFLPSWTSHGNPVTGDAVILEGRFLVVAAFVANDELSGCGIDKLVKAVEDIGTEVGVEWALSLDLFYRDESGEVNVAGRRAFRETAAAGRITTETTVFDPSVTHLGLLRAGAFELPVGRSWHKRLLEPVGAT